LYDTGLGELSDPLAALRYVVMAILGSPHFLYRVEIGEPDPADESARLLSGAEIASKLAYFLWNAPPDDELLGVGEAGTLSDPVTLAAQAARLIASPRFAAGVGSLFDDYLSLGRLDSTEKLDSEYPEFSPTLAESMRRETQLVVQDLVSSGRDFRELFTSRTTFVDGALADLYGIEGVAGTGFVEVELPATEPRAGLLGQASILSIHAHSNGSSPTRRGKFVREVLLCQAIPAPPPNVDTQLPEIDENATTRERVSLHSTDLACAGCHTLMDPIGLGLENFDGIGAYRATENGNPIDASGELDGTVFSDPSGLGQALSNHANVPDCMSRAVFRYAWGRLETGSDAALVEAMRLGFESSGHQLSALIESAILAPGFSHLSKFD
jgi:hypothetical protein